MTVVVDAGVVVAALVDAGPDGVWAATQLTGEHLTAPHLMPVEVADILRRSALARDLSADGAALAHADLMDLRVDLFPYEPFADRVWELRRNLTCYDAWYVALAEEMGVPLVTLDRRIARASGPRCEIRVPRKT